MTLSASDRREIVKLLGREPTIVEEAMFDVMWSEHCSYRSSKRLLSLLPTKGERVIQGPGENAGVILLTDNWYLVMKIESHNHPSAVEPYQGAATGVGGIIRDILAMNARPIALLDSLWFGKFGNPKTQYYLDGIVSGIADYGNCIGVPVVGGETVFLPQYQENPLVNVMCIGIVKKEKMLRSAAKGIGNLVVLVGSKTGKDGIGGASFASEELNQSSEEKRPSVQVGDPFTEKLLIEACTEAADKGMIVAMQDLGAAGLTSSLSEMAYKGGYGIEIELQKVPLREAAMKPEEIMISESQERMALIVEPPKYQQVKSIFEKWGIECVAIGQVIPEKKFRVRFYGKIVAEVAPEHLTKSVPPFEGPATPPKPERVEKTLYNIDKDINHLLDDPNFRDKSFIYQQYDYMVGINTILPIGEGASIMRIKEINDKIGISIAIAGDNSSSRAVKRAYRQIVASGATPVAITDCLNFGNPEDPDIYGEFSYSVKELARICKKLNIPVISGNVSFYNETSGKAIPPTIVIGMVGIFEDVSKRRRPILENPEKLITVSIKDESEEIRAKDVILQAISEDIIKSSGHTGRAGLIFSLTKAAARNGKRIKVKEIEDKNAAYWLEVKDIKKWEILASNKVNWERVKADVEG